MSTYTIIFKMYNNNFYSVQPNTQFPQQYNTQLIANNSFNYHQQQPYYPQCYSLYQQPTQQQNYNYNYLNNYEQQTMNNETSALNF